MINSSQKIEQLISDRSIENPTVVQKTCGSHQGALSKKIMGNSDLCRNGPNCWFLWNSDCWYKHPWEEKKKVMEMKREVKKALEEKKRVEEDAIAEEAFARIPNLPEELRMLILHHLQPTIIEKLELSVSTLRSVLQVIKESFLATE